MVFYFLSEVVTPSMVIYMGRDKYENEELIKWGWPEDIWFHTDKLSSAHVYLRLPKGGTIDDIPNEALVDCAQLTKANSIQGCKLNDVPIVYTPWSNLKKTGDMDVGQIGFHKNKAVRTIVIEKKANEIINRLNKTKEEMDPNFREEREQRDREERAEQKKVQQQEKVKVKEREKVRKEEADLRNYSSLMTEDKMRTNRENSAANLEDDFM